MSVGAFLGLLVFVVIKILQSEENKRKDQKRIPQPRRESSRRKPLGFEIPHLEGAPQPKGEVQVYREEADEAEEEKEQKIFLDALKRKKKKEKLEKLEKETKAREIPKKEEASAELPGLSLNPQTAFQAVVLAEVLGRPKALRNRGRFRR